MSTRLAWMSTAVVVAAMLFGLPAVASAAPPANDNVVNAQTVGPALPLSAPANNIDATAEAGEPAIGGNTAISTVWFKWVSPINGQVVVDLCNAGFTGSDFPFEAFSVRTGAGFGALVAEQAGECSKRFTAVATQQYKIQVDYRNNQGNFTFRMRQLAPPANDNFATPTTIGPALPVNLVTSNVDSSWEVGEPPALGGSGSSRSVWYSWTAPLSQQVRLDVCTFTSVVGASNRSVIVYTGNTLATLVAVTPGDGNCEVTFNAIAGTVYRIGFSGTFMGEGNFVLRLKNAPPPPNDNFASAITVGPALPVTVAGNNEFATVEAGEPDHTAPGFTPARSEWFKWTPTRTQRVRIRGCNREGKTRIGVYTGIAVNLLTTVGEKPPFAPHCSIVLNAIVGTTYRIAVAGGLQDGAYGPFGLDIHLLEVPGNDDLADATVLGSPLPFQVKGSTVDATVEDTEPSHELGSYGDRAPSVWYRWTAPDTEPVIFSACSSTEPVRIAVYSMPEPDVLEQVTSSEKGCAAGTKGGRLAIAPDAGTTYFIAVAAADRDWESDFILAARGAKGPPVVVNPPKSFNLKTAIRKCKVKFRGKSRKAKRGRTACIRRARKKAAIIKCRKVVNPTAEAKCIRKARRRFR